MPRILARIAMGIVLGALAALALPHIIEAAPFAGLRPDLHRALILGRLGTSAAILALVGAAESVRGPGLVGLLGLALVAAGAGRWPVGARAGMLYGGGHAIGALTLVFVSRARQALPQSPLNGRVFALMTGFALLALATSRLPGRGPAWVRAKLDQAGIAGATAAVLLGVIAGVCAAPAIALYADDVHFFAERNQAHVAEAVLLASCAIGQVLLAVALGAAAVGATGKRVFLAHAAALALMATAVFCFALALPDGGDLVACRIGSLPIAVAVGLAAAGVGVLLAAGRRSEASAAWVASTGGAAICAVGLFLAGATTTHAECIEPSGPELSWAFNDAAAAISRGQAEHKPILIYFHADWCQPCHELEHRTFANPSVREALSQYVLVKVDCTEEWPETAALKEKYAVRSLPTLALLDSSGHLVKETISGFVPAGVLAKMLAEVR